MKVSFRNRFLLNYGSCSGTSNRFISFLSPHANTTTRDTAIDRCAEIFKGERGEEVLEETLSPPSFSSLLFFFFSFTPPRLINVY
jgi:hypothetical protein